MKGGMQRSLASSASGARAERSSLVSRQAVHPGIGEGADVERRPSTIVAGPVRMPVMIAVPLYRAPHLVAGLCRALTAIADEIRELHGHVVLINDSPDDEGLRAALTAAMPALCEAVSAEVLANPTNLGFVRTANRVLRLGEQRGADVILLNSDALPTRGAFAEMARVSLSDPMISVVSPRSNNATICNSPYPDCFRGLDATAALQAHLSVARHLPPVTYVPTAVGFCLYVRRVMIQEFGVFDEIYGGGYNEENDFIMRCNLAGYRAVLANHAFVHHLGNQSFSQSTLSSHALETVNRDILLERYPHYDAAVHRYFAGIEFRTQRLLAGLALNESGQLRVLMDARNVGAYHNGTFEHTRALLTAFGKAYGGALALYIACSPEAAAFHRLDAIPGMTLCDPDQLGERPFAIAFRIAQPFKLAHLKALGDLAPLTGFLFLDTIAMDCLELDVEDFHQIWTWMTETTALIGFNSAFTARQFKHRFSLPADVVDFVSLCSTDVSEYAPSAYHACKGYLLVVGNHYLHKHVKPMVDALRAQTCQPLIVLGGSDASDTDGVTLYRAGELEQTQVDAFYEGADAVVFPSHYEGFGLPILHALARGKPVFARDLPPSREIKARCAEAVNLHLFATTAEIAAAAAQGRPWRSPPRETTPQTWATAAETLYEAMLKAIGRCDYDRVRTRVARLDAIMDIAPVAPARPWLRTMVTPEELGRLQAKLTLGEAEPAAAGSPPLRMVVVDGERSDPDLIMELLHHAEDLAPNGLLMLDAAHEQVDARRARLLLIAAGLAPGCAEVSGARLRICASLFVPWAQSVPSNGDDHSFIQEAYKAVLGREVDPAGLTNYLRALNDGLDRRGLLAALYTSKERLDFSARLHGASNDEPSTGRLAKNSVHQAAGSEISGVQGGEGLVGEGAGPACGRV